MYVLLNHFAVHQKHNTVNQLYFSLKKKKTKFFFLKYTIVINSDRRYLFSPMYLVVLKEWFQESRGTGLHLKPTSY